MRCFLSAAPLWLAFSLAVSALPPHHYGHHRPRVRLLYQYPSNTWIENIAVRSSGELLLTILTTPHLDQLNPFEQDAVPETIYSFSNATSVGGIAEVEEDVFVMSVGNFTDGLQPVGGSWGFWERDLTDDGVKAGKIVSTPEIVFADGLTNIPGTKDVLTSDIKTGKIWRVDTETGEYNEVISNNQTRAVANVPYGIAGVNGLHIKDDELYFTNTGLSTLNRMPLPSTTIPPTTVLSGPANTTTFQFDDFAFSPDGNFIYYVTGGGNSIERVGINGGGRELVVGNVNSTMIAGPTSCAFGRTERDRDVLYVVTSGGLATPVNGREVVGAQVLAVRVGGEGWGGKKGWK